MVELLSGARLYGGGEIAEIARRILEEPPPDIDDYRQDTPPEVVALLLRLLAKSPEHRPASAAEVADELEPLINEIALLEGPYDVGEYCASLFADDRREREETIATRLSEIRMGLEETSRLPVVEARPRRGRRGVWAGAAALLFAAAALAAVLTRPWSAPPETPATADSLPTSSLPPAGEGAQPRVGTAPEGTVAEGTAPESVAAEGTAPESVAAEGTAPESVAAEGTAPEDSAPDAASGEATEVEAEPATRRVTRRAVRRAARRRRARRRARSESRAGGHSPLFVGYGTR